MRFLRHNSVKPLILSWCLFIVVFASATDSIAQWVQTNGPFGGRTYSFAVIGTTLFAGTEGGGVYRSTNNAASWEAVNTGLPKGCFVRALLANGTDLFAGTWGRGLFLSTDNGTSWTAVNNGLTNFTLYCLASLNNTILFVGTQAGVFRSTDYGANWTLVLSGNDIRAFAVRDSTIFAATWGADRMYRSTDNGNSWTQLTTGLTTGELTSIVISGSKIFVGSYSQGTFLSTDNGDTWLRTTTTYYWGGGIRSLAIMDTILFAATGGSGMFRSIDDGANWVAVNSGMSTSFVLSLTVWGTKLFAGTSGTDCVYFSTDRGASWQDSDEGIIATGVGSLGVKGPNIFAGSGGGVHRSGDNGENWTPVNDGLTYKSVSDLLVKDPYIFAGTWGGGVFRSSNDGESWESVNQGLNNQVLSLEVKDDYIFAGTYGNGIYRSSDNGLNWIAVNNGFAPGGIVFDFAVSSGYIFAGAFIEVGIGGVYRSTDDGNSWTQVSNGLTDTRISALEVAGDNLFAGTLSAFSYGGTGVYRTTNDGANWTQVVNGLTNLTINTLASVNETNLFAGTGEGGVGGRGGNAGVALSTNNGESWAHVNEGLWNTVVGAFQVSGDHLFVGAEGGGVWRRPLSELIAFPPSQVQLVSPSNGAVVNTDTVLFVWQPSQPNIDRYRFELALDSNFTLVQIDSNITDTTTYRQLIMNRRYWWRVRAHNVLGWGPYSEVRSFTATLVSVDEDVRIPLQFRLDQNFPNPFNPSTTFVFDIPTSSFAILKIYDVLGEEIASLVNEFKQPGEYRVSWDATGYASGLYFYRLQAGNFVDTKKLLLLR